MSSSFAILVKSYANDADYVERLIASLDRHNLERIPVYLVVPENDIDLFESLKGASASVMSEEVFSAHLTREPVAGFSAGYINQEIIKLAFWEAGLAENYLCLDSDAEFIRDFSSADFMYDASTPYTFISEDSELRVDPQYFAEHWQGRELKLLEIRKIMGISGPLLRTTHGHSVFSGLVLRAFKEKFLEPRGWDYVDALAISPYEPTWYNAWLEADQTIDIHLREPIIKTFHNAGQHLDYVLRGLTAKEVSRGYVAVVVNSNYSSGNGVLSLSDPQHLSLASYVSTPDLLRAIGYRFRSVFRRKS